MNEPKVSIITVCYNAASTIEDAILSVLNQHYDNIEYIIVDGVSRDNTLGIVGKYKNKIAKIISEPDKGIYDAMNKGLRVATGNIIGILNADDIYASDDVISRVVQRMELENADVLWGDLIYVKSGEEAKIMRIWKSSAYAPSKFRRGWMPPHPTFFVRKTVYEKYGLFRPDFKIAADYELMLRFVEKYKVRSVYLPEVLVKMRVGGATSKSILNIKNIVRYKLEDYKAWKINGLGVSFVIVFLKPLSKITQYFKQL